jgi:effector-binding domain-containing protein
MNLPPITKEQKFTLLFTAFLILLFFIFLLWKPNKDVYRNPDFNNKILSNKTIDTLEYRLKKQTELNVIYVNRIEELEKSMDSIKTLITENSKKITTIKKRRTDEKKVNYNAWTDNEFTRFLSNRYQQH